MMVQDSNDWIWSNPAKNDESKAPVQLCDCEIKQARGDKMEVMLKGNTKVLKSPDLSILDFEDDG